MSRACSKWLNYVEFAVQGGFFWVANRREVTDILLIIMRDLNMTSQI